MADITLDGNPAQTRGDLPEVGASAPDFVLTNGKLQDVTRSDFGNQTLILNIFPSVNTGVCSMTIKKFNERIDGRDDATVLCISADLPFSQQQFCGAAGLKNVEMLSTFRHPGFGDDYGTYITTGPFEGLQCRAALVIGDGGEVRYSELVREIGDEPDYDAIMAAL